MLFLILLAIIGAAIANPILLSPDLKQKHNCTALVEDSAWIVSDLVVFNAKAVGIPSFLSFNLLDTNKGLHINTTCSMATTDGSNNTLANPDVFHACEQKGVLFQYLGDSLQVTRRYRDKCFGDYPLDTVIAHGNAEVKFNTIGLACGRLGTLTEVAVPISSLSG